MSNDHKRQQKDAVTIGQIRSRYLDTLERQIGELSGLIRKGYHSRHEAEKFLSEDIGRTLTTLDNLDSFAMAEIVFPKLKQPAGKEGE